MKADGADALAREEQAMATAEKKLAGEWAKVETNARTLEGRVLAARARLAKLAGEGADSEELRRRLGELSVAAPDATAFREAALVARREALNARQRALDGQLAALHAYVAQVATLEARLGADEAALSRAERAPGPAASSAPSREAAEAARRVRPRVRMQAVVSLKSADESFSGFSTDISEGGLFVAMEKTLPLGTEVEVEFPLNGEKVRARGVVRWLRKASEKSPDIFPGMGIQFHALEPALGVRIARYVAEREPLNGRE